MKRHLLLIIAIKLSFTKLVAQHAGHQEQDTSKSKISNMDEMPMDRTPMMSHSFYRNLPMNRNGSVTSWQTDSTPEEKI